MPEPSDPKPTRWQRIACCLFGHRRTGERYLVKTVPATLGAWFQVMAMMEHANDITVESGGKASGVIDVYGRRCARCGRG